MRRNRIMFHVQHLLGIGHLQRALRLCRHLRRAGFEVTLVSGGMPLPAILTEGVTLRQLAPARAADAGFSQIVDAEGNPIGDVWRARRTQTLLEMFEDVAPDALLIELFPFGRRQFAFELLPLLEAARGRRNPPLVLCSVRDIVAPSAKPGRTEEAVRRAQDYFDHVLVHGDPAFLRLEATYPAIKALSGKLFYSGYVADAPSGLPAGGEGENEILVSAGGGAVGGELMRAALYARAHAKAGGHLVWRLLIGSAAPRSQLRELQAIAPPGIVVEPARADFPQMLLRSACSVSQAGYNTVMDILGVKALRPLPAVVAPFVTDIEQEQMLRAAALERAGLAVHLPATDIGPEALAAAVDRAMSQSRFPAGLPDMKGGPATARFLRERLDARQ
jgi:predicted glycosyltransferase